MPFFTVLKYPFTQLHKFYAFLSNAKSTRWPGFSRCGPSILILALLSSIVQISLHLWLAITISELPTEVQGCHKGNGIIGLSVPHKVISRPVTYADVRGKMAFSVNGNAGIGNFVVAVVMPFVIFFLVGAAILHHFSERGMSNRWGLLSGWMLFLVCLSTLSTSAYLNIEADGVRTDYSWCWMDAGDLVPLVEAREARYRVYAAIAAIDGLEIACALLYTIAALWAARLNANTAISTGHRLQDLSSDGIRIDNHARSIPQEDAERGSGTNDAPAQDPFGDFNAVTTSRSFDQNAHPSGPAGINTVAPAPAPVASVGLAGGMSGIAEDSVAVADAMESRSMWHQEHRVAEDIRARGESAVIGIATASTVRLDEASEQRYSGVRIHMNWLTLQPPGCFVAARDVGDEEFREELRSGAVDELSPIEEQPTPEGSQEEEEEEEEEPFEVIDRSEEVANPFEVGDETEEVLAAPAE